MRILLLAAAWLMTGAATQAQSPECSIPIYETAWRAAAEAHEAGDWAAAAAALDAPLAACADMPDARPLRVFRADVAIRQSDFARAVNLMRDLPHPSRETLGVLGSWIVLRAARGAGDVEALNAGRAQLLSAVEGGLLARGATLRERIALQNGAVAIYATDVLQGAFRRRYIALFDRRDSLPMTVSLTLNGMIELMQEDDNDTYFVDAYYCAGHATLAQLSVREGALPAYEAFRTRALDFFTAAAPSDSELDGPPDGDCAFLDYLTPDPLAGPQ